MLPFFEANRQEDQIIDEKVVAQFMAEERRTLGVKLESLATVFAKAKNLFTVAEARIVSIMLHCCTVAQWFSDGVNFVERMLLDQLVAAIGKEVRTILRRIGLCTSQHHHRRTHHSLMLLLDSTERRCCLSRVPQSQALPGGVSSACLLLSGL